MRSLSLATQSLAKVCANNMRAFFRILKIKGKIPQILVQRLRMRALQQWCNKVHLDKKVVQEIPVCLACLGFQDSKEIKESAIADRYDT